MNSLFAKHPTWIQKKIPPHSQSSYFFTIRSARESLTYPIFIVITLCFDYYYWGLHEKSFSSFSHAKRDLNVIETKKKFFLRLFFQPTVTMNLNAEKKLFFLMFKNRHFKITICEMDWTEYVTILMLISFHTKLFKFFWKEKSRISRLLLRRNSTRVLKEENKEN